MYTETLSYGVGGYRGAAANKCWIAAILGSDEKFGMRREFIEAVKIEREHYNRPRTMITHTYELPVGLYESSSHGEREIFLVYPRSSGEFAACIPSDARINAMLLLMDGGMSVDDARKQTKGM